MIKLYGARSLLYRHRSLQVKSHFSAIFEIYKILTPSHRSKVEIININKIFDRFRQRYNQMQHAYTTDDGA